MSRGRYEDCVEEGVCAPLSPVCRTDAPVDDLLDQTPATCVTWDEAAAFCAHAGGRLPTEAEWEKASRGTDGATWPWGRDDPTCNRANFHFTPAHCEVGPLEGGHYPTRSPFGLADTAGNVWEWTADWYDARSYRDAPDKDPPGPSADCHATVSAEAGACDRRVIRGGAWNVRRDNLLTYNRSAAEPVVRDPELGFRCAYDG